jgi:hypothetical protein
MGLSQSLFKDLVMNSFANCCQWKLSSKWMAGFGLGLALSAMLLLGFWLGRQDRNDDTALRELLLRASTSHGGKTMAMATGPIDESEGLFVLDYLTGELNCFVINPRSNGKFNARFTTNVVAHLGVKEKKTPDYVMVTGGMDFLRGAAQSRPANCVVYVADANTGNFAAFGLEWNRTAAAQARPQAGALILLDVGKARSVEVEGQE